MLEKKCTVEKTVTADMTAKAKPKPTPAERAAVYAKRSHAARPPFKLHRCKYYNCCERS